MTNSVSSSDVRRAFADRHIGPNDYQIKTMLMELGFKSLDQFIEKVVPQNIFWQKELDLPKPLSENEALAEIEEIANENQIKRSMIGMGYYGTKLPHVILRNVLENPAWYTAYTPYQPEISQGRLEVLFAFQTLISDLTGLPIANASMLDEATAAAEAITLAHRATKASDDAVFLMDVNLHPQNKAVIETRAKPLGLKFKEVDFSSKSFNKKDFEKTEVFTGIIAYPCSNGLVNDVSSIVSWLHQKDALAILDTDPLFLTLHKSVAELGGDIAVGSAQRFGTPMGFGGPHAGFLAVRTGLERSLPGRLVGQSVDAKGEPAYRLALQTREQHIRRDKATSNICTAQVLLAVISGLYAIWHGPAGLKTIATAINIYATNFAKLLLKSGYKLASENVFDTVTITDFPVGQDADSIAKRAVLNGFNFRLNDKTIAISFDEFSDDSEFAKLCKIFEVAGSADLANLHSSIASDLLRKSEFLQHPIFNTYHSETAMLRYMRNLADRDLALDRTMIPLGSCTMKLNATAEMIPVTWPEFSLIHPYAPSDQTNGYLKLIEQLSNWLTEITGYDVVSLQPNAGSQGEFAGLLAIRNYLDANGGKNRKICLIPESAHGTNAASAVMAGMQVVVIKCDELGNVSIADIKEKINEFKDLIAALMVTYPSTHGVFESAISEICGLIHDAGGQVYVDGANLNALVGLAKPGKFGADVSHLNLHKTFCIPHGGGGPGVGPVIARAHLAEFLPANRLGDNSAQVGPVSAAPYGSASILPISWMYIRMMGSAGLKKATSVAILSANYLAKKLESDFPILYKGESGLIAHECIIDLREITKQTGVTVDDVAKRLMDHGFHAPTVSFPVAGTMMIEPTESEDIRELDRFLEAMKSIREEIREIEAGKISIEQSPLRFAPHTSSDLLADKWDRKYSREVAAFPNGRQTGMGRIGKYWPTVSRIDGAHGDRNLVCACLPIAEYAISK